MLTAENAGDLAGTRPVVKRLGLILSAEGVERIQPMLRVCHPAPVSIAQLELNGTLGPGIR